MVYTNSHIQGSYCKLEATLSSTPHEPRLGEHPTKRLEAHNLYTMVLEQVGRMPQNDLIQSTWGGGCFEMPLL